MPPRRARAATAISDDFEEVHDEIGKARNSLKRLSGKVGGVDRRVTDVRLEIERVRGENAVAIERSRSEATVAFEQGRRETAAMETRLVRWIVGTILAGLGVLFSVLVGLQSI